MAALQAETLAKLLKAQQKNKVINIRMTERQRDLLDKRTAELGCTISDYLLALLELDYSNGLIEKCAQHDMPTVEDLFGKKPETMRELNH